MRKLIPLLFTFALLGACTAGPDYAGPPRVASVGADGFYGDGFARGLGRSDDGLGGEIEGDAKNVGILDVEEVVLV